MKKELSSGALVLAIVIMLMVLVATGRAEACTADVGTATTSVYVRDADTGEVVGSLAKGDKVVVVGKAARGYKKVRIGDTEYKVYGEYLDVSEANLDEVKLVKKPRKSKSGGSTGTGIKGKKKQGKIKGSIFEGVSFW